MSSQDLASDSPRLDPEEGGGQRLAPAPPQDADPALALRVLAAEVGRSAHRVHLGLAVATVAVLGLVLGPDTDPLLAALPLSALQRGVVVGAAVGALNLAALVWLGERLFGASLANPSGPSRPEPEPEPGPEPEPVPGAKPEPSDSVGSGTAAAAATVVVASGKLVVFAVLLWAGKRWLVADPVGLVVGFSLAPVALAAVGWRRLHSR